MLNNIKVFIEFLSNYNITNFYGLAFILAIFIIVIITLLSIGKNESI